jgi:hypothetical protein
MSISTKHFVASAILAVGIALSNAGQAFAASLSSRAILTADNHYGLFHGNSTGSTLNFVGRNEYGPNSSTGKGYNWSHAESWNFTMDSNDYLYVVVWDDRSVDESWVGEFSFTDTKKNTYNLLSKPDSWEYIITQKGTNPGDWGDTPSNAELNWEISNASWISAKSRGLNDGTTKPWGRISEVTKDAEFLNTTTNSSGLKRDNNRYTIFRTKLSVADVTDMPPSKSVPEPASAAGLVAIGAVGAYSVRKRNAKAQ